MAGVFAKQSGERDAVSRPAILSTDVHARFEEIHELLVPGDECGVSHLVPGANNAEPQFLEPGRRLVDLFRDVLTPNAKGDWPLAAKGFPRKIFTRLLLQNEMAMLEIHWEVDLVGSHE